MSERAVDQIRRVLADGFAFVRGNEVTEGVSASTFAHMLSRAITNIEEDASAIRPSKLSSIRSMKQSVLEAVEQARRMPADVFELSESSPEAVNTQEDDGG